MYMDYKPSFVGQLWTSDKVDVGAKEMHFCHLNCMHDYLGKKLAQPKQSNKLEELNKKLVEEEVKNKLREEYRDKLIADYQEFRNRGTNANQPSVTI
jgi:hypothetical protein